MINLLISFIGTARATDPLPINVNDLDLRGNIPLFSDDPMTIIVAVINWLLWVGGALAVVALVYSGIMYITSGSNPDQAEKAKKNIAWAIMGIIFIALAILIVTWINTWIANIPKTP